VVSSPPLARPIQATLAALAGNRLGKDSPKRNEPGSGAQKVSISALAVTPGIKPGVLQVQCSLQTSNIEAFTRERREHTLKGNWNMPAATSASRLVLGSVKGIISTG